MSGLRGLIYNVSPWARVLGSNIDGSLNAGGICYNIIADVFLSLNISYRMILEKSSTSGMLLSNSTWVGMVKSLIDNEADFTISPLTASASRCSVIDLSVYYYYSCISLLGSSSPPSAINIAGILMVFDLQVWIFILFTLCILILVSALRIQNDEERTRLTTVERNEFYSIIMGYLAAVFMEGTPRSPNGGRARCLFGAWWLLMVLLGNAFCGLFRASMMTKREGFKIRDLDHLAAMSDRMRTIIFKNSAYEQFFREATTTAQKEILRSILAHKTGLPYSEMYTPETLTRVIRGQAIIANEVVMNKFRVGQVCSSLTDANFYMPQETFYPHGFAFGIRKGLNRTLVRRINRSIRWYTEAGFPDKIIDRETRDYRRCIGLKMEPDPGSPLLMDDIGMIFALVLLASGISSIVFFLEVILFKLSSVNDTVNLM